MPQLRFGTGGVPRSSKGSSTLSGLERLSELGLDCMEVEFVYGVKLDKEEAERIGQKASELDIKLSAHGPYYINLASLESAKVGQSRGRLVQTAKACSWMGADRFTFHAAFYQGRDKEAVFDLVREQLTKLRESMDKYEVSGVSIRPELTGKETQFGDLEELIRLSQELRDVYPCIDFAHAHARYAGKLNGYNDFMKILRRLKETLGQAVLDDLHMHVSGILYTAKGERHHLPLVESDLDYEGLVRAWKDMKVGGTVICESPEDHLEEDALLLREVYSRSR